MSTTLASRLAAADLTADGLAAAVGVAPDEAERWITAGDVPAEHLEAVDEILGEDSGPAQPQQAKQRKKAAAKRRRTGPRGLSADVVNALKVCTQLMDADSHRRDLIVELARVDTDGPASEQLFDMTARMLALPKTTGEALKDLERLLQIDNPFKIGAQLGDKDRPELTELYRVCCAVAGRPVADLPSGDDAVPVVRSCSVTSPWLRRLRGTWPGCGPWPHDAPPGRGRRAHRWGRCSSHRGHPYGRRRRGTRACGRDRAGVPCRRRLVR